MRKTLIASLLASTASVQAGSYSGNDFLAMQEIQQISYVVGVIDGIEMSEKYSLCLPKGVTGKQLAAVSKKYAADNPESLHYSASSTIVVALNRAFPCK